MSTRASAPRVISTPRQAQTVSPGMHRVKNSAGLYLSVKGKARSWTLRFPDPARKGKTREMGLGPFPEVPLAGARAKAKDARELVREGHDPLVVRDQKRAEAAAALAYAAQQADKPATLPGCHPASARRPRQRIRARHQPRGHGSAH